MGQMVMTRAAEQLSAGRRFLSRGRRAVMSAPSFTISDGVRYYDQAWLRKATDIVEGGEGM
jgi:hypothetical protein